jgi:regulator of protease activity HflC (stomatin/prohibitin superfamily)
MENAFAWIGQTAEWVGRFFPHITIVPTTHGAVKFVKGKKVVPLGPGIYVYLPLTTQLVGYPTARQAVDLRPQTIVTKDDKTIAIGALIVYEIMDIAAILAHTYDPEETVRDIAMSGVHDVCCQYEWEDLKAAQRSGKLDTALRQEIRKGLEPYGVKLMKATLTDLAPCRVIKLMTTSDHAISSHATPL